MMTKILLIHVIIMLAYYDLAKQAPCLKASKNLEFRHNRLGYKHYEAMSRFISVHGQNTTKPNHEYIQFLSLIAYNTQKSYRLK